MAKVVWENDGNPLPEGHAHAGEIHAMTDAEDGTAASHFYGKTYQEVANKVLESQANAMQHLNQLRREHRAKPEPLGTAPAKPQPRPLSADERIRITSDLGDPAKSVDAVKTIVERLLGAPLERLTEQITPDFEGAMRELASKSARQFLSNHPEYWPSEHNNRVLENYSDRMGWKPNVAAFEAAYEECLSAGLLQAKPEEEPAGGRRPQEEEEAAPPAKPALRARGQIASTGLRNAETSGAPGAGKPKGKYRLIQNVLYEDGKAVTGNEYRNRMNNPEFVNMVNNLQPEL